MLSGKSVAADPEFYCPQCQALLLQRPDEYRCGECGSAFPVRDGVAYFAYEAIGGASDYSYSDYQVEIDKIRNGESGHFWFRCRRDFIGRIFRRHISASGNVLEIGAGTGFVAEALIRSGYKMSIGEIHDRGIRYIRERLPECQVYQFDLRYPPFREQFDTVCLFDVLEHIEDDESCVKGLGLVLKTDGRVVLTVPAYSFLWCQEDVVSRHYRRYSAGSLSRLMAKCGFKVVYSSYFFTAILPLLFLRIFQRHASADICAPNPIINTILEYMSRIENIVFSWFPSFTGGSLILVAEKQKFSQRRS